ncbi:MAG: aminomethyl-transferring glycine dehydrogenase subunit GcvPB [Clostridiales bacterium]|nr:aminomethyl-transferring glycine dehydrogenase subunit GcvPB [Clostridiales bacterium]
MSKLIFEMSRPGRRAFELPETEIPQKSSAELFNSKSLRKSDARLPEVSELDVVRHFTELSNRNFGVDTGFYPLGSCTMKYNPKINEKVASFEGFTELHPHQPADSVQGALELMHDLETYLAEITGMDYISLQPSAGAQGEMAGLMVIKAYHEKRRDTARTKILCPDSAHGTNPASAAVAGFDIINVKSNERGMVDVDELRRLSGDDTAGLMLTNPNTLGLFEKDIIEIAKIIHDCGGLLYYDGANANAILGQTRPGDMGFDVVHLNLHKTFTTPHGGGGPGSGPVGVVEKLRPFLPVPFVVKDDSGFRLEYDCPQTIGSLKAFYGHFAILVRAYSYILSMGGEGLNRATELAVLNANYIRARLEGVFDLPNKQRSLHEVVFSEDNLDNDCHTLDVAKRLIDYGYHPPTIYFPLVVHGALMIEPTETESKQTLDEFCDALLEIAAEAKNTPELLKQAPIRAKVRRLDEATAARKPKLRWQPKDAI